MFQNYLGTRINIIGLKSYLYCIKDRRKIKLLLLKHLRNPGALEFFWNFFVRVLRRIFLR